MKNIIISLVMCMIPTLAGCGTAPSGTQFSAESNPSPSSSATTPMPVDTGMVGTMSLPTCSAETTCIGTPGKDGAAGIAGSVGPQGPAGTDGAVGPVGPQGPKGDVGLQGPVGNTGVGLQGVAGPAGPAGPAGTEGKQGVAGSVGPKGDTGAAGSVGPAGPAGSAGAAGPAGSSITQASVYAVSASKTLGLNATDPDPNSVAAYCTDVNDVVLSGGCSGSLSNPISASRAWAFVDQGGSATGKQGWRCTFPYNGAVTAYVYCLIVP